MSKERVNKKILEYKKNIKEQKKKIKIEKRNIRRRRRENFKKSKFGKSAFGKFILKIFFIFNDKDNYSFSELFVTTIVSLLLGFFTCFSIFTIINGGVKLSKDLRKFNDVYEVLIENYNGKLNGEELIDKAIEGMVASVGDAYTSYGDVEAAQAFDQLVSGTYEGIGCTIRKVEEGIVVVDVYDNTPAFKAGLKADDIILTVDDKVTKESTINDISNYIKEEAAGKIKLVVKRGEEELEFTLERAKVEVPSVSSKVYEVNDKKIGYIDIAIFSSVTAGQFKTKLEELEKEEIAGLVIDVRDNNGGYLNTVTDVINLLLPKGKIMYQVKNNKNDKVKIFKDKTNEKRDYPIAVLTNGNSASASEILAAVIKESYDGYVVGKKTYGKGTVQQVKKLSDGSMIKYTTENWLTPLGNWINQKGVEPTDEVELNEEYYSNPSDELDNQLQKALELVSK